MREGGLGNGRGHSSPLPYQGRGVGGVRSKNLPRKPSARGRKGIGIGCVGRTAVRPYDPYFLQAVYVHIHRSPLSNLTPFLRREGGTWG
jgi:hypothetical protein